MIDDPLCPKTVACDKCRQVAVVEIIHLGERMEDSKRDDKSRHIPLTIHCAGCGRHKQPWRD
jgi:hypothetical protein